MMKIKKLKLLCLAFLLAMVCGPLAEIIISKDRSVAYHKYRVAEDFASDPNHRANIAAIARPIIYGISIGGLSLLGLSIAGILMAREGTCNK